MEEKTNTRTRTRTKKKERKRGLPGEALTDRHCAPLSTTSNQSLLTFLSSGLTDAMAMRKTGKKGDCEVNKGPVHGIRSMHRISTFRLRTTCGCERGFLGEVCMLVLAP